MIYYLELFLALTLMSNLDQCAKEKTVITSAPKMKVLIIDGENNHGIWPKTTWMMRDYLEETGLFEVEVDRTQFTWQGPHHDVELKDRTIEFLLDEYPIDGESPMPQEEPKPDPDYRPSFDQYDMILSNFGWKASTWQNEVKAAFEEYVRNGGGLVIVHAANNSWGDWTEYNKMIGLGGWGGRSEKDGPYVYYDSNEQLVRDPSEGQCGSHGAQMEYVVTTRASDHPIMNGLPTGWLHAKDELYDRLRGPAENMTVLATAYSDVEKNGPPWNEEVNGSGRHEPMLMAMEYGKGRIFHTALGHMDYSMECVGFITTLQRGAEWAATGKVTQEVPKDFPGTEVISTRSWTK